MCQGRKRYPVGQRKQEGFSSPGAPSPLSHSDLEPPGCPGPAAAPSAFPGRPTLARRSRPAQPVKQSRPRGSQTRPALWKPPSRREAARFGPGREQGRGGGGETRGAPPLPRPGSASPSRSVAPTRAAPPAKTRRSGFCAPRPPPPPQCGPNGPALGGEGGPERERTRPHAGPPSRAAPPLRDPGRSAAAVGRALPGAVRLPRRAAARARRPSPGSAVTCPRLWARSRGRAKPRDTRLPPDNCIALLL